MFILFQSNFSQRDDRHPLKRRTKFDGGQIFISSSASASRQHLGISLAGQIVHFGQPTHPVMPAFVQWGHPLNKLDLHWAQPAAKKSASNSIWPRALSLPTFPSPLPRFSASLALFPVSQHLKRSQPILPIPRPIWRPIPCGPGQQQLPSPSLLFGSQWHSQLVNQSVSQSRFGATAGHWVVRARGRQMNYWGL
jgi:hypothetical protein